MLTTVTVAVVLFVLTALALWKVVTWVARINGISTNMDGGESEHGYVPIGKRDRSFVNTLLFPDLDSRMVVAPSKLVSTYSEVNPLAVHLSYSVSHTMVKRDWYLYRQQIVDSLKLTASSARPGDENIVVNEGPYETTLPYSLSSVANIIDETPNAPLTVTCIHNTERSATEPDIVIRVHSKELQALVLIPRDRVEKLVDDWERVVPLSEMHFTNSGNLDKELERILNAK